MVGYFFNRLVFAIWIASGCPDHNHGLDRAESPVNTSRLVGTNPPENLPPSLPDHRRPSSKRWRVSNLQADSDEHLVANSEESIISAPFGVARDSKAFILSPHLSADTQASFAFAAAVNAAAFFRTNSCTLSGRCPVSVSTSSDNRSKRPARCRSPIATRWFTR